MPSFRALSPALAAILAACVVLLGLAAVSPGLHDRLHGHHEHHGESVEEETHAHSGAHDDKAGADCISLHDDHVCAVTLFAHGCETPVIFSLSPPLALHAEGVASFTELLLSRTPRGPERVCGPPALG